MEYNKNIVKNIYNILIINTIYFFTLIILIKILYKKK